MGHRLVLVGVHDRREVSAPWAAQLLAFGARLARWRPNPGFRLIVAISTPARDYAAILIAAGWLLTQRLADLPGSAAVADTTEPGAPVRMMVGQTLIADRYYGLQSSQSGTKLHVGKTWWLADRVRHLQPDLSLVESRFGRTTVPDPGSLVHASGRASTWLAEHCTTGSTVAVVGTRSRLYSELDLEVGWAGDPCGYDKIQDILRPDDGTCSSWASAIIAAGKADAPELPAETRLSILDGSSAIRWLPELTPLVTLCLLDRSAGAESAGEAVLHARAAGREVSLEHIRWKPAPGFEALAFEVRA